MSDERWNELHVKNIDIIMLITEDSILVRHAAFCTKWPPISPKNGELRHNLHSTPYYLLSVRLNFFNGITSTGIGKTLIKIDDL